MAHFEAPVEDSGGICKIPGGNSIDPESRNSPFFMKHANLRSSCNEPGAMALKTATSAWVRTSLILCSTCSILRLMMSRIASCESQGFTYQAAEQPIIQAPLSCVDDEGHALPPGTWVTGHIQRLTSSKMSTLGHKPINTLARCQEPPRRLQPCNQSEQRVCYCLTLLRAVFRSEAPFTRHGEPAKGSLAPLCGR